MLQRNIVTTFVMALACVIGGLTLQAQDQTASTTKKAQAGPSAAAPINLNTATVAQLETLPGVGPAVAARILEYRQKNGNFKKIEELMNVKGIGEKSFLKIKALITVAPSKTTDK
jgi:competence protein ComEA